MAKKTPSKAPVLTQIKEFYQFMVEQKLESLEYDNQGLKLKLVRQRPQQIQVPVPVMVAGGHSAATAGSVNPAAHAQPAGLTIKAPMMGIFYRASSPSSPPFVKQGDKVKKGFVICLIEAMKVFNEVKADFDCTILSVLLENGKPVKAGQDLYVIERN